MPLPVLLGVGFMMLISAARNALGKEEEEPDQVSSSEHPLTQFTHNAQLMQNRFAADLPEYDLCSKHPSVKPEDNAQPILCSDKANLAECILSSKLPPIQPTHDTQPTYNAQPAYHAHPAHNLQPNLNKTITELSEHSLHPNFPIQVDNSAGPADSTRAPWSENPVTSLATHQLYYNPLAECPYREKKMARARPKNPGGLKAVLTYAQRAIAQAIAE